MRYFLVPGAIAGADGRTLELRVDSQGLYDLSQTRRVREWIDQPAEDVELWCWDVLEVWPRFAELITGRGNLTYPKTWSDYARSVRQWADQLGNGVVRHPRASAKTPAQEALALAASYQQLRAACHQLLLGDGMDGSVIRARIAAEVADAVAVERARCLAVVDIARAYSPHHPASTIVGAIADRIRGRGPSIAVMDGLPIQ